jgi:hypothetical protein
MMIRRAYAAGLIAVACSLGINSAVAAVATAPRMEHTATYILAYCRESRRLPLACPHLLPRMEQPSPHWETSVCVVGRTDCQSLTWDDLSLVDAGYVTRPPVWSHVSIYAGNLKSAFRFAYPTRGVRPRHLDGLFARARTHAIFLGWYAWGGKRGTVVLAPDYPDGGDREITSSFAGGNQASDSQLGFTHGNHSRRLSPSCSRWCARSSVPSVACAGVLSSEEEWRQTAIRRPPSSSALGIRKLRGGSLKRGVPSFGEGLLG